ncbi:Lrp/AsnC ligand binding domain-containing protein [Streptomyces sp. NPDC059752]|uniref:Lrp/AsnC ligand binding domain-containing protein n=1 Tax=unclassified Streptomyces TaxID=2593676 RepID=UPI00365BB481
MAVAPAHLDEVATTSARHDEPAFVAHTTGPTNPVAHALCKDTAALYRYLTHGLGTVPAIRTLETAPVLRTLKAVGTIASGPASYRHGWKAPRRRQAGALMVRGATVAVLRGISYEAGDAPSPRRTSRGCTPPGMPRPPSTRGRSRRQPPAATARDLLSLHPCSREEPAVAAGPSPAPRHIPHARAQPLEPERVPEGPVPVHRVVRARLRHPLRAARPGRRGGGRPRRE